MRTTLTIDDDLAAALKVSARRSGRPFKAIVNEAIRRGLSTDEKTASSRKRFRVSFAWPLVQRKVFIRRRGDSCRVLIR